MASIQKLISFIQEAFGDSLKASLEIPAEAGVFSPFPVGISKGLVDVLASQGIDQLYSHQAKAYQEIQNGKDTLMISKTASGKTLSFLLPILDNYIKDKKGFSVLMLYPTKALSRDQEGTMGKMMKHILHEQKIGTYDGDTPREEREKLRISADFIITNPDMLHSGILPNHNRKWKSFLARLKYIVIDEVHTYRGAFGSHVSNVFKRLLRICRLHGSEPIFICSSATIGNPREYIQKLFGRDFSIIDIDGSPRPNRHIFFINPPIIETDTGLVYRQSIQLAAVKIIEFATKHDLRTIAFCRARQEVERLYTAVLHKNRFLYSKVKPYRGGLLPNERRQLENDLFSGKLSTIISTNALELGINIGDLDICILCGHPGSIASFWQQAGRVGRSGRDSLAVFISKDLPIDQYMVNHPHFILNASLEEAWLNADNPYILLQHLPCAAYELPLEPNDPSFISEIYPLAIDTLLNNNTLAPFHGSYRYALHDYPARGVNLRGMTDYNIEIHYKGEVIGELDPISARGTLYKDAIYQHVGKRYISLDLDLSKKLCQVDRVDVNYITEAVWEGMVTLTKTYQAINSEWSELEFGEVNINKQPKLYKKIKLSTKEVIGYGPITLPAFIYDTTGFCLKVKAVWLEEIAKVDQRYIEAGIRGLSYILKRSAPGLCMGDIRDIDSDVSISVSSSGKFTSSLYLFDSHEGGVGFAEKIFEKFDEALNICLEIIENCDCRFGCPSCVPPQPPGVSNAEILSILVFTNVAVECTKSLIQFMLSGQVILPTILTFQSEEGNKKPVEELEQERKLKIQLSRAADILTKKRERTH
jgi:DEAD/DEAH box helicase domain-containing protein